MDYKFLVEQAVVAEERSYAPYSKFKVGAAVLSADGDIYLGANIENVCSALGMCAERVALYNALSCGAEEISAISIYHNGEDLPYPCGACLQVLSEFNADGDMDVIISNNESTLTYKLNELLPHSFRSTEI